MIDQVKGLEEVEKTYNEELMGKYQKIQKNFTESIKVKENINNLNRDLNDHKIKVVLYE